ncbi:beta barrel domain-containing protein [Bacillus sp. Brlt_9]|uniref:beta barrel domain-containing protein n=1 Tax=Bacillus sp. Brlt_9 TaxID=3110916 RepID=UPI003F7CBD26
MSVQKLNQEMNKEEVSRGSLTSKDFKVGQTIWIKVKWHKRDTVQEGKITKVGRLYVTVNNQFEFTIKTLNLKNNSGYGRLFLSEDAFEIEEKTKENLKEIRNLTQNLKPEEIGLQQTEEILKILHSK